MNRSVIRAKILTATQYFIFFLLSFCFCGEVIAQNSISKDTAITEDHIIVVAGKQYARPASHQRMWGVHYRKEWAMPVKVKMVRLDTLEGGVKPYEQGGGRQTKTLRLRDSNGREYVLRSIDKSFGKALPDIFQGSIVERIIDDQVSIAHPYSSLTIPNLAAAAKIYHTKPQIFYLPEQPALDTFNKEYANQLYLFEQRPDENWETAANFGNPKNIVGTEKMLEELLEDNDHKADQLMYVRCRLFDWIIGDWGRHEDQWRWAVFNVKDEKIFRPIPRDRDQAYTLFDGKLLNLFISSAGLKHLQSFDTVIRDIAVYNFPSRNLDRRLANQPSLQQWLEIAKDLQQSLTNEIIENAIRQLPPEVFELSGNSIITKIKGRRDRLTQYANDYYKFLAKEVDVVGTNKKELFVIQRLADNATTVQVYGIKKSGEIKKDLLFERRFVGGETNEIRLYGMGSDDIFRVEGNTDNGILLRIIGGKGEDSLQNKSLVKGNRKLIHVYDDEKSRIPASGNTRLHIRNDSALNSYQYSAYNYDKKGFGIKPGFFSLTFGYGVVGQKWKKEPAGYDHSLKLKYSINRGAVAIEYNGILPQSIGKWNLVFTVGGAVPKVNNFFGIGNETMLNGYDRSYYRLRSHEYYAKAGVNRKLGKYHLVDFRGIYETVKIKYDVYRFIRDYSLHPDNGLDLGRKHFIGAEAKYRYLNTDHAIIPEKGFGFLSSAAYTRNLSNPANSFSRLTADASVYIPVFKFISLAFRAGGASNIGESEFYHLNILGSHENLRGYRKYRFYGKDMVYNNNEIRFIFDLKTKILNGKSGFVGFYDNGRVWQPGEVSDTWHSGYGAGLFFSFFNKVILSGSYGISKEDKVLHAYFGFYF
jgi:hypothetical protein